MWQKTFLIRIVVISTLLILITVSVVSAAVGVDSSQLRAAVTADNIITHLTWLEDNGPRVSGTPAYDEAAKYVTDLLREAGYIVSEQPFAFDLWEELADPVLERTDVDPPTVYPPYDNAGFATMEYSGSGDVTAPVVLAANLGCDPADFGGADFRDKIALILRGVCTFSQKATNAQNAGAAGVIVFNDLARQDAFLGTLGGRGIDIPVVGSSYAVGQDLTGENVTAHLVVTAQISRVSTKNIIAETPGGRDDRLVVVGAHLDTVAAGPGINDNGSGVAAILEIALQMAKLGIEPRNKVRFAFWGAEESGLFGSQYYVDQLNSRQIKNTALNLNFDMIASRNYARFVYDGDGSDTGTAGPNGSKNIEAVFVDYFVGQNLPNLPTEFDGRSDYGPFIDAGIPAGGLFSGAEGGYDDCYHYDCDNLANINQQALEEMSDAAAHAILTFGMTTSSVNGTDKGKGTGQFKDVMEYQGSKLKR